MATRGVQFVAYYGAWDTAANDWKTGDSANHALQWVKDGSDATATNAGSEIDAVNSPGQYKVTVTSTEADCLSGQINGVSSTADVILIPTSYAFVYLPNAVPGAAGGVFIAGSNAATTTASLTTGAISATTITASGAVAFQSTFAVTTSTALGALSCTTLTASGAVAFQSTFVITGATTMTGTVSLTNGLSIAGGTLVHALRLAAAATGHGVYATGNTTGNGIYAVGGADGHGMELLGGATSGNGLKSTGPTAGAGATFGGTQDNGISSQGDASTFSSGFSLSGYYGFRAQGTEGVHIQTNLTSETAVFIQGGGDTPTGIVVTGGIQVTGPTAGDALTIAALAASGGAGISSRGDGAGLDITAPNNDLLTAVSLTSNVKTNQALAGFTFLMTDSTNHAPLAGLGAGVTVSRSIDAGAFGAGTLSAVTEVADGAYSVDFGAGDMNGKVIVLQAIAPGADTTFERIVTQP